MEMEGTPRHFPSNPFLHGTCQALGHHVPFTGTPGAPSQRKRFGCATSSQESAARTEDSDGPRLGGGMLGPAGPLLTLGLEKGRMGTPDEEKHIWVKILYPQSTSQSPVHLPQNGTIGFDPQPHHFNSGVCPWVWGVRPLLEGNSPPIHKLG